MNRSKKGFLNMSSHLLDQAVTAVCGFIVPRLMLETFGSETNGVISSISQFLGIIALLESGFGSVAKTAFYKPLANNDVKGISGVFNATESFFRRIALIFAGYCIVLALVFPAFKDSSFDYIFVMTLVFILGLNSFMQYYFGVSYVVLFNANQRGYISGFLQVATIIANAVITVIMLNAGAGVHLVKLVSACVFIVKPIVMNLYGRKSFRIDYSVPKDEASLSQKWDNLGQSVAMYIHTKTDAILITFFLNFSEVSVYSVYSMITTSLSSVIASISSGFVSALGNMYAKEEKENFNKVFSLYEFVNTSVSFLLYTIAFIGILPFIKVYTINVNDIDYIRPLFAGIIVVAELLYCIRLPYYYMITNAKHFRQIKKGAYVEAGLNICLSLVLISFMGINGLVIGTSIAMLFRTVQIVHYCSENIIKRTTWIVLKRVLVNLVGSVCSVTVAKLFTFDVNNFIDVFIYFVIIGVISLFFIGVFNILFFRRDFVLMVNKFKSVIRR